MTRPITIHLLGVLLQLRLQGGRVLLQGRRFPCGSRRPICGTSRTKATTAPTSGGRTEVCRKRPFAIHADRRRPRLRAVDLAEAMMVGADQAEFIPHALQEPLGVALLALHAWRAIEVAGRDHRQTVIAAHATAL